MEHFRAGLTGEVTLKGKISPGQEPYTFTSFTKGQQEGGGHRFSALNLRSATALLFCGSLVTHPSVLFHSVVFPILSLFFSSGNRVARRGHTQSGRMDTRETKTIRNPSAYVEEKRQIKKGRTIE